MKCTECEIDFEIKAKEYNRQAKKGRTDFFCCRSCSASWHNRKRRIGSKVECDFCGSDLYRKPFRIKTQKTHYCNRECRTKAETTTGRAKYDRKRRGNKIEREAAKEHLISENEIKCSNPNCRIELFNDPKMVDMHHWGESTDHTKVMLLCPACHRAHHCGHLKIENGIVK